MTSTAQLEQQSQDYLQRAGLTSDFFCKYDPDYDYVLTFDPPTGEDGKPILKTDANGKRIVEPRCIKLEKNEALETRNKFIDERFSMIARLTDVHNRIDTFEKMLLDYMHLDSDSKKTFNATLDKIDPDWQTHLVHMQKYLVTLESRLSGCFDEVYSKHQNTLLQMKVTMCEPLSEIVTNIEQKFYPRIFYMEEIFGKAQKETSSGVVGWISSGLKVLLNLITSVLSGLKNIIRTVTFYIYTYGRPALASFGNALGPKSFEQIQTVACKLQNDPKKLFQFYIELYTFLDGIGPKKFKLKFVDIVRDKIRSFCNPQEKKLVPFVETTVQQLLTEFQIEAGNEKTSKTKEKILNALMSQYATIIWQNSDDTREEKTQNMTVRGFVFPNKKTNEGEKIMKNANISMEKSCSSIKMFARDVFGRKRVVYFLWMICITSLETIRKILSDGSHCSSVNLSTEQTSEDEKDTDQSINDFKQNVTNLENRNELKQFAPLQPYQNMSNFRSSDKTLDDAMEDVIAGFTTKLRFLFENLGFDKTNSKMTEKEQKAVLIDPFVSGLFSFFWFFANHNFLATKDVENGTSVKYGFKTDDARTAIARELDEELSDDDFQHNVPKYVRYAYCKAQNNSPEECATLVETGKPIHTLADGEARYAYYLQQARAQADGEKYAHQAALLPDEDEVAAMTEGLLRDARLKHPELPKKNAQNDEMALRLKALQMVSKDFAPEAAKPVAKKPIVKPQVAAPAPKPQPPIIMPQAQQQSKPVVKVPVVKVPVTPATKTQQPPAAAAVSKPQPIVRTQSAVASTAPKSQQQPIAKTVAPVTTSTQTKVQPKSTTMSILFGRK